MNIFGWGIIDSYGTPIIEEIFEDEEVAQGYVEALNEDTNGGYKVVKLIFEE